MRWDDLRHLEALARTGSAAAAARELRVATSTVYRRVEALEAALGSPCLERGAEGIQLTPTGRTLVALAARTREELARARGLATERRSAIRGEISLTTVEGFLPFLIEPIEALLGRHPGLSLRLDLGDSGPSVRRREVDVAIGVMARPPQGLIGRRLFEIRFGVFGTREAVARSPHRWIVCGPPMEHTPEAAWERENAEEVVLRTGSRHAFFAFLRQGLGVGLAPQVIGDRYPELVEIEAMRESARSIRREAWLLVHPQARESARVRALMDALIESLEGGPVRRKR